MQPQPEEIDASSASAEPKETERQPRDSGSDDHGPRDHDDPPSRKEAADGEQNRGKPDEPKRDEDNEKQRPSDRDEHDDEKGRHKLARTFKVVAVIVGIAFICFLTYSLIARHKQTTALAAEAKREKTKLPIVQVAKPHFVAQATLTLPGSTEAIEDAVIGARSTGYVRRRYVDIGSHVRAGQVLVEIEAPDLDLQVAQARHDVARARATVQQARADVANKRALVAQGQSNLKQAQANLEQARAQLANAEANLAAARHTVDIKRAALAQAVATLDLASKTLNRYQTLLRYGYVALQDVDQSQSAYDTAVAGVRSAQSDVDAAQATADAAAATVKAFQKNVAAVGATVTSNAAAVAAAQANVRESESNVAANEFAVSSSAANTQRAAILAGYEKVTAPFDGVITARNVDIGSLINAGSGSAGSSSSSSSSSGSSTSSSDVTSVSTVGSSSIGSAQPATAPGTGLFGLARTDAMRVMVSVPQTFAAQMRPGVTARLVFQEYPGRQFIGAVYYVAGALDTVSRTLLTEIHVPNENGVLRPGMYTQVQFDLPDPQPVLRVPSNTLIVDAQGTRVAEITKDNKVHFQHVTVGRDFGAEVEITQGLTGQETLIATPTDDLVESEAVQPQAPNAAPPAHGSSGSRGNRR